MFAALLDGIRADIDRQIDWAKVEVRRQTRYTALIGLLASVAVLAAVGAIVVGLIALYFGLAMQAGPFTAFKLATGTLRHGSRSAILGTLVCAAVVGLIAGRRL